MELLDIEEDELGDVEFLAQEKKEIKKKHQAEYVNNFHYSHLEEGVLQDLDSYVRWHKEHPGTTTPRKARGVVSNLLDSGTVMVSQENPDLVYTQTKAGRAQRRIPMEFKSKDLGRNAEFTAVTAKAHEYEHQLRLKESLEFEDPWWNKSVKDQVFVHHIHEYQDEEGSWEFDSTIDEITRQLSSDPNSKQINDVKRNKTEELALVSSWGKKPRNKKTIWEDPREFCKYTVDGTEALEGFTLEALNKNLEIALQEYEASEQEAIRPSGTGLSSQAAELHQRLTDYRDILGGLDATEKIGEQFVKYSTKIRKQTEGGKNMFEGKTGDFLDACVKSNPAKVLPMLLFGANPNTMTEDDEPVFVMTMKKVIFSDASKGSEQDRDSKERKNCFKIMDSLVQYGADINCLVSESKITPLMIASSAGHTELVTWLLSRSANPNIASPLNGSTALMFASKYGHPKCIAEIVRHKGNLNAKDNDGNTPLHYAAQFGQTRTAKFLLRIGASRFVRNKDGRKPAEVASHGGYFVTSQIIAGFCPSVEASAPALKYINDNLFVTKKPSTAEMVKNAVKGLFRAASNLFSSVDNSSEPFFERFMDSVSQFRAKCREFEYRDIIAWIRKITQKQIQPIDPSNESKELVESPPQATPISS